MDSNVCAQVPEIGVVTISLEMGCQLEWRIPDFLSLLDRDFHFSPTFSIAGTIWRIAIDLKSENIHVDIVKESIIPPMNLEISVGFKTLNGKKDRERCAKQSSTRSGPEVYVCHSCLRKTELQKRKSDLLPSNTLTVVVLFKSQKSTKDTAQIETEKCLHCKELVNAKDISSHEKKCVNKPIKCPECTIVVPLKNWYDHECNLPKDEPSTSGSAIVFHEKKLLHDFKELFLSKEDCDVVINVQGQEFPAHRNILKARSPVFASTFKTNKKEKATGIVDIEDCDPSSFLDFLGFLYCGDAGNVSKENVFSLFTTSDKYQVEDLRAYCVKFMKDNLSVDTFCDTITLALQHSETELIKLATDFFIKNAPKIIVTVKWQTFAAKNPTQSNELFVKLLVPESHLNE